MRFLVRMVGVFLFAAAFVALVIDGTRSIAGNAVYLSSLGESVRLIWPNGLAAIETALSSLHERLWDPAGLWLFAQPAFVVLGLSGLCLMLLGRRKPRLVRPLPRRY